MSGDIPPLISETPPPLTKLDWADENEFMDISHMALELPSESSLSPDSGWNPIDELLYDNDVTEKPIEFVVTPTNDDLSNKHLDIANCDESSEQETNLPQNNLSILKEEENNKEITSNDDTCEINRHVFFEDVIDSNKKKIELSLIKEQHSFNIDNKNLDLNINNANVQNYMSETCRENITNFIQDQSSENINESYSFTDKYETLNSDKPINNNNISNDQNEINYQQTDFCEFKTVIPNSVFPLPNRTSEGYLEKTNNHTNKNKQFNDINSENNLDSEFGEFSDFHSFNSVTENSDVSQLSIESSAFQNTEEMKNLNIEVTNYVTDNKNLNLKSDNFNNELMFKSNDILNSESYIQINYKHFCKDAFQGNYELCEEVDLQNLDFELNKSLIWQNLKDIESSLALNYNWSKSESNKVFLSSLSIDSRNILFGASWNPKVPRFAANLSNNPLEPLKTLNNTGKNITQFVFNGSLQGTIPVPEFDWKSSGLINPLDFQSETCEISEVIKNQKHQNMHECSEKFNEVFDSSSVDIIKNHSVSIEAQNILDNFPDFEILQKPYLVILNKCNTN